MRVILMSFLLLTLQLSWTEKEEYLKHSQFLVMPLTWPYSFTGDGVGWGGGRNGLCCLAPGCLISFLIYLYLGILVASKLRINEIWPCLNFWDQPKLAIYLTALDNSFHNSQCLLHFIGIMKVIGYNIHQLH